MNNAYNNINIEKLQKTLTSIKNLNTGLESNDISQTFFDIEIILRTINFEHGNCINNYKAEINAILDKLNKLKENTTNLENALSNTLEKFSTVEHREVSQTANQATITQIPPETNQQVSEKTSNGINTVPIGLGIAATGIAGSVGAVVLNSKNEKQKHTKLAEEPEVVEKSINTEEINKSTNQDVFDNTPYHASRDNETKNKFYGTNITEYYEKEDDDQTNT